MARRRHCDIAIREAVKGKQQIERHRGIDVRRPWPWLGLSAGWSAAHRDHPVAPLLGGGHKIQSPPKMLGY
jgi:hypothetical protein